MLCHQCGSPVDKKESSCPNCGADLSKTTRRFDIAHSRGLRISQEIKAIRLDQQLFPPGETISKRFVLAEMIGKGPFGDVYRARDEEIETDVAVKIFRKELIAHPKDHEQFLAATRRARSLSQANVVRIHDAGVHKDHPWVSMQYLEGLSLRKVLDLRATKKQHFELTELEPVITQVIKALEAGRNRVPHGDLKPENIIFMPEVLKVSDTYLTSALSHAHIVKGLKDSPYVAPELLSSEGGASESADVYSLGMIFGEMIFGPDYVPGSASKGPLAGVDALCKRATAFDPSERHQSVRALGKDLKSLIDAPVLASPPPAPAAPAPPIKQSIPVPPPPGAPKIAPPPAPSAVTGYEEATDSQIIEVTEDEMKTLDFSREPELQDLLPTNEVDRDLFPKPELSKRTVTQTAIAPRATKPKEEGSGNKVLMFVGLAALCIAIVVLVSRNSKEVVTLNSTPEASTEKKTPVIPDTAIAKAPDMGKPDAGTKVSPEFLASTGAASLNVVAATKLATGEAKKPLVEDTGTEAGTDTATGSASEVTTSKPAETKPQPSETVATKVEPEKKPSETKSAGTSCKPGMTLVKSKRIGNYCVDVFEYPGRGVKPKSKVTWFDATKICKSKGKRLCQLKEWKSACGSKYPYGRSFNANKCNTQDEDGFERTIGVTGVFKGCRSKSGTYDMSGNVFEWVEERRIAGGSFESDETMASCRFSSNKAPGSSAADIGFRCCADPQ